jgi:hypothetical protein
MIDQMIGAVRPEAVYASLVRILHELQIASATSSGS